MDNMDNLEKLATKAASGDSSAFEYLYRQTYRSVYYTCYNFLKNEQDTLDITQDTYLTAYNQLKNLDDKSKFSAWLMKIAANKCRDYLRKKQPVLMDDEEMEEYCGILSEESELNLPEDYVLDKEKRKIVMDIMIKNLSDTLYQTVILYYFDSLSVAEIADIMGCPEGTVKYRLSVARAKIKEGVLSYERKNGIVLRSAGSISFMAALLVTEANAMDICMVPLSFSVSTDFSVAGAAMASNVAETGGKIMLKSIKAKIIAGVLGTVLVGGGVAAAVVLGGKSDEDDNKGNTEYTGSLLESSESTEINQQEIYEEYESEDTEDTEMFLGYIYSSDVILPGETLYDEEEEGYSTMLSIQGRISDMDEGGGKPALLVENEIYSLDYFGVEKSYIVEGDISDMRCFDSDVFGRTLVVITSDGRLSAYNEYGEVIVKDLPFDDQKDHIGYMWTHIDMISEQDNGYVITYYDIDEENGTPEQEETNMIESYNLRNWDEVPEAIKEILFVPTTSSVSGYDIYCLSEDNNLYEVAVDSIGKKEIEMTSNHAIASDVSQVYCGNGVWTTTLPIYSKASDSGKIYTSVLGEDWLDSSDDIEITFVLPDGHTTEEIKTVFGSVDYPMLEFSNGDVYFTEEIDSESEKEYTFTKMENVSELNSQGHILKMVGPTWSNDYLYMLMDDNNLYYIEF